MTDERQQDDAVSAAYRELASEKTPARLDRQVLEMARKHAKRPTYAGSIRWTRPLAWAATITLCLAITLELARVPPAEVGPPPVPATQPAPAADPEPEAAPEREAAPEPESSLATQTRRERQLAEPARRAVSLDEPQTPGKPERADEVLVPGETDMAKVKNGVEERSAQKFALTASQAVNANSSDGSICPEAERASPETWLACIDAMRDSTDAEIVQQELDRLAEAFPDFQLP